MKEIRPYVYAVRVNETVTIEFDPQNGAGEEETAMTIDDKIIESSGGTKPTYVFDDTKQAGTHFGKAEGDFAGNPPDNAQFVVTLTGSVDGKSTFIILKKDEVHDPDVEFRVKTTEDYAA
jgi:hypothetical protein